MTAGIPRARGRTGDDGNKGPWNRMAPHPQWSLAFDGRTFSFHGTLCGSPPLSRRMNMCHPPGVTALGAPSQGGALSSRPAAVRFRNYFKPAPAAPVAIGWYEGSVAAHPFPRRVERCGFPVRHGDLRRRGLSLSGGRAIRLRADRPGARTRLPRHRLAHAHLPAVRAIPSEPDEAYLDRRIR